MIFHGLPQLQNNVAANDGIKHPDIMFAIRQTDGVKNRFFFADQLVDGDFPNADITPV